MQLLKQHSGLCLLYSAAMVLDTSPERLIELIGHDGLDQPWLPEDSRQVAHTPDEIQDCCLALGKCLYPISAYPFSTPEKGRISPRPIWSQEMAIQRFESHIHGQRGILIGTTMNNVGHAVAWDGESIYDPRGQCYSLKDSESFILLREAMILGIKSVKTIL